LRVAVVVLVGLLQVLEGLVAEQMVHMEISLDLMLLPLLEVVVEEEHLLVLDQVMVDRVVPES
jgi:hypothetical protein|tara:strand:+ start:625 stop:813 length:189 start_codon:yes stop_codon:yes gene_type:complete